MLRVIFFDLGNTLVSIEVFGLNGNLKAIEKIIMLCGLDKQPSEYLSLAKDAQDYISDKITRGQRVRQPNESLQEFGVRIEKARYAKLMELMGGEPDEKSVELVFKAYLDGIATVNSLFPEVRGVLGALKGEFRLGLISNSIVETVTILLRHVGLEEFFDVVVISGAENVNKPDPEIFHRALGRIGAVVSEAMMVGDSLVDDIKGAKGVGMTAVWINRSGEKINLDIKPNYIIMNLRELLDIVQANS